MDSISIETGSRLEAEGEAEEENFQKAFQYLSFRNSIWFGYKYLMIKVG